MGTDRSRKNKIRSYMAATGANYVRAAREIDADNSYLRGSWGASSWQRLLPREAVLLESVIGTATVLGQHGDLATLISTHAAAKFFPNGVDTDLTWTEENDDAETIALRRQAQRSLEAAVSELGRPMPATVGDLVELLAALGVYQRDHASDAAPRWWAPVDYPSVLDVLPVPDEWRDQEEQARWMQFTGGPALHMLECLRHHDTPQLVETTLQNLAADSRMREEDTGAGIEGLMYRYGVVLQRHDRALDRDELVALPEHARFRLLMDWDHIEGVGGEDDTDQLEDDGFDDIAWSMAPWHVYRGVAEHSSLDEEVLEVVAYLPFQLENAGGASPISLAQIASGSGSSVGATVSRLIDLESAGILRWNPDTQTAHASMQLR